MGKRKASDVTVNDGSILGDTSVGKKKRICMDGLMATGWVKREIVLRW